MEVLNLDRDVCHSYVKQALGSLGEAILPSQWCGPADIIVDLGSKGWTLDETYSGSCKWRAAAA